MKKFNAIDLFCGCGGFSQGFEQAGYRSVLGIDLWNDATTTYKYNFPDSAVINEDIIKLSVDEIIKKANVKKEDVDVIIGGPPCQGFSISGKRMIDAYRQIGNAIPPVMFWHIAKSIMPYLK